MSKGYVFDVRVVVWSKKSITSARESLEEFLGRDPELVGYWQPKFKKTTIDPVSLLRKEMKEANDGSK